AVAKMIQRHGRLNQRLKIAALRSRRGMPQILPHFVGLEEIPGVEEHYPREIARVILIRPGTAHGRILSGEWSVVSCQGSVKSLKSSCWIVEDDRWTANHHLTTNH